MNAETHEVLTLFVKATRELESWKFIDSLRNQGPFKALMHRGDDGSWVIEDVGPNDAETRAFLTTFRLFVQKKEPVSLYRLDQLLADPDLSDKWKQEFQKLQKSFLHYLSQPDETIPTNGDFPTREHIMDIFINGRVFHWKQEDKRQIYEKWAGYGEEFGVLVIAFNSILYTLYNVIVRIAQMSEEALIV